MTGGTILALGLLIATGLWIFWKLILQAVGFVLVFAGVIGILTLAAQAQALR